MDPTSLLSLQLRDQEQKEYVKLHFALIYLQAARPPLAVQRCQVLSQSVFVFWIGGDLIELCHLVMLEIAERLEVLKGLPLASIFADHVAW